MNLYRQTVKEFMDETLDKFEKGEVGKSTVLRRIQKSIDYVIKNEHKVRNGGGDNKPDKG